MTPKPDNNDHGPKYFVDIEGTKFPWDRDTISVSDIRDLGGIPGDQQIQEIDLEDNTEVTLAETAVVEIKPGHGFAKKVRFQRG